MRARANNQSLRCARRGSVLVIVLWIAFGMVSLALYFAHSMNFELRASDNRVCAMAADQAIDGAVRYVNYLLVQQVANGSNGVLPVIDSSLCQAVPVGEAHYWMIGRDTNNPVGPGRICFGLVDEASKLNLNVAAGAPSDSSNQVIWLPRMTMDLTQAILDWVNTNGNGPTATYYAMQQPPYQCKCEPFETVDELRLLYGADMDTLVGEDANRNGILDPNETDDNQNNRLDPGVLEYCTVYSREPNTNRINLAVANEVATLLPPLLQTNFGKDRADKILIGIGVNPSQTNNPNVKFNSPLDFYATSSTKTDGITSTEFAQIATNLTATSGSYVQGRVNVNTASAAVLACLAGGDTGVAQQLVNYRQSNPNNLISVAWIVEALGQGYPDALATLKNKDYLTTQSYQFTADIAALGPFGRGYRRVKFVFDTCDGTPRIVYRQDLTHLGWALGKEVRQNQLAAKGTS